MIEVKKRVGPDAKVVVISHFFSDLTRFLQNPPRRKVAGALAIGFVGRIVKQKNLIFAIETLASAGVAAELHIFGEVADEQYLAECQRVARDRHVSGLVHFRGNLAKEDLLRELSKMDLFFSPTLGENFGHAILEALSLGLPVLLSTETPWLDVATYHAGWALDLADKDEFSARVRFAFGADEETWASFREGARSYAIAKNNNPALLHAWHTVLQSPARVALEAKSSSPGLGDKRIQSNAE
jgi:glycosyltransferase involved in cell wall biosynthesis